MNKRYFNLHLDVLFQLIVLGLGIFSIVQYGIPNNHPDSTNTTVRCIFFFLLLYQVTHLLYFALYKKSPKHQRLIGILFSVAMLFFASQTIFGEFSAPSKSTGYFMFTICFASYIFFNHQYYPKAPKIPKRPNHAPLDDTLLDDWTPS